MLCISGSKTMQPMKMSFLFLVDSALQKDADNIPPKKLTAILLRSEIYRLISLPACSGTHIQGMHPLLHCISLVAIFAIIPFMPPWRQIFSSTHYCTFSTIRQQRVYCIDLYEFIFSPTWHRVSCCRCCRLQSS